MKRLITGILTVAMVFSIGTVSAFAAGHGHGRGRHHVETNADYAYCHFAATTMPLVHVHKAAQDMVLDVMGDVTIDNEVLK